MLMQVAISTYSHAAYNSCCSLCRLPSFDSAFVDVFWRSALPAYPCFSQSPTALYPDSLDVSECGVLLATLLQPSSSPLVYPPLTASCTGSWPCARRRCRKAGKIGVRRIGKRELPHRYTDTVYFITVQALISTLLSALVRHSASLHTIT